MPRRNLVLALVVDPSDLDVDAYLSRFAKPHLTFRIFESVKAFRDDYKGGGRFHGVVIETRTILKANFEDRAFMQGELEGKLPVGKFSAPRTPTDKVHELLLRKQWENFLVGVETHDPRGLRAHPRQNCVLQARLAFDGQRASDTKSVTVDLSNGGCFVMMAEPHEVGTSVDLWFGHSKLPFKGRVSWKRDASSNLWEYPGVGIEFVALTDAQKVVIERVIELARHGGKRKAA